MNLTERDIARFWAKVDVRGPDECWPWKASRTAQGYGQMSVGGRKGKPERSNRIALAIDGRLDENADALHRCNYKPCCNPAHLYSGGKRDNAFDERLAGTLHGQRLSKADLATIRAMCAAGFSFRAVGRVFKIPHNRVSCVHKGENLEDLRGTSNYR